MVIAAGRIKFVWACLLGIGTAGVISLLLLLWTTPRIETRLEPARTPESAAEAIDILHATIVITGQQAAEVVAAARMCTGVQYPDGFALVCQQ